jgi:uncharacterized membrane protein (DUF4010 family)
VDLTGALPGIFVQLGIALGLGLLVGLQRERAATDIAGFRTFTLVTLLGAVCGLLSLSLGGWVLAGGFAGISALVFIGNLAKIHAGHPDPGITTEVAVLLMFAVGAFVTVGPPQVAVAVGGATVVLLQWKRELHGLAARLGDQDVRAAVQFVLIAMVVLPVLPNRAFGPYAVLNPRQIWWMVVLIVGLSLVGYVGTKLVGERAGTWLGGALGGLVSSTATTVAFARRTRRGEVAAETAAQVIVIASAVVYVRVLVEIAVVSPAMFARAWPPLATMLAVLAGLALLAARLNRVEERQEPVEQSNPSELPTALLFAAIYAAVVLAVAWAKARLGSAGMYAVAGVSGLVDLEAITLSSAQLVRGNKLDADLAWRLVLLASLVNIAFKGVIAAAWGGWGLARRIALVWALAVAVGVALLVWWPGPAALAAF